MSVISVGSGTDFNPSGTPYALVFTFQFATLPPQNANQYPIFYAGDGSTGSAANYLDLSYGPNPPGSTSPYGLNYTGYHGGTAGRNQLLSSVTTGTTYICTVDFRYNLRLTLFTLSGGIAVQNNTAAPGISASLITQFSFGKSPSYANNSAFILSQAAMFTQFTPGPSDLPAAAVANINSLISTSNTPNTAPYPGYLAYKFGTISQYNAVVFNSTGTAPTTLTNSAGIQFTDTSTEQITFAGYLASPAMPCFVKGTRILLSTGYKAIEDIKHKDKVVTADGREVAIKIYYFDVVNASKMTAPYRISASALGPNCPPADLCVSPLHAVQDSHGIWQIPMFAARKNSQIKQYGIGETLRYYHIECPNFYTDNIYAEGCVVESLKNRHLPRSVIYTWNDTVNGFVRINPDKPRSVPKRTNVLTIHG
jgi:Hint domain